MKFDVDITQSAVRRITYSWHGMSRVDAHISFLDVHGLKFKLIKKRRKDEGSRVALIVNRLSI